MSKLPVQSTYHQTVSFLKQSVPFEPRIGIICGSGLSSLADNLCGSIRIPYRDIPHFPTSTIVGHSGELAFGYLADTPVVCMKGRFHFYEGYSLYQCTYPVRIMKLLGVKILIVTNAAGGVVDDYNVGDVMLIKDHINFVGMSGNSPLIGPNDDDFGTRFPAMNKAYDRDLLECAKTCAKEVGLRSLHEGVYACLAGPTYETIAELKMLKTLGVQAVGMSTAHEVVVAVHAGMKVLGFSLITNKAVLDYDSKSEAKHSEVVAAGKDSEEILRKFVTRVVEKTK